MVSSVSEVINFVDTPIFAASRLGQTEEVATLLASGADANELSHRSNTLAATPLCIAAQLGHAEVVAMLLNAGAAVDKPTCVHVAFPIANKANLTPMYFACDAGQLECAQILSSHGASRAFALTLFGSPSTAEQLAVEQWSPRGVCT